MEAVYLAINGQTVGPYSSDRVWAMFERGEITRETLAWYEGLAEWVPAGQVLDATARRPAPVPVSDPAPASASSDFSRRELREIARSQRILMWAVLCGIIITILVRMAPLMIVFALFVVVFEFYALIRLGLALRLSVVFIVLSSFCLLIPCVSLIVLFIFSVKASGVLKAAGVRVGLMGADPNDIG